jgi:hypothetical protein
MTEITWLVIIVAIIAFFVLLAAAIFMIVNFYVCDNQNCKAFTQAATIAPKGSREYVLALLTELYNDGIWPLPYIGAGILTPLLLWLTGSCITIENFAIGFFVSFIVIYFLFAFLGHHYIKFIANYVASYIVTSCPSAPSPDTPSPNIIRDEDIDNNDEIINNQEEIEDEDDNSSLHLESERSSHSELSSRKNSSQKSSHHNTKSRKILYYDNDYENPYDMSYRSEITYAAPVKYI